LVVAAGVHDFGLPLDKPLLFERFYRFPDGGLRQAKLLGEATDLAFFIAMKLDKIQTLDLYRADTQSLCLFSEQYT
jgi:hypothetical protein